MNKHAHRYIILSSVWGFVCMGLIVGYDLVEVSMSTKILFSTIMCIVVSVIMNYIFTKNDIKDMIDVNNEIMKENHELATAMYEHKLYKKNDIAPIVFAMAMVSQNENEDEDDDE